MLGLFKATVVLAPVLKLALAAAVPTSIDHVTPSSSLVTLELGGTSDRSPLEHTALELRIFESTTPCGQGNVTLNGEPLLRDDLGLGSGSLATDSGNVLAASWKFTCVHLEGDSKVQLLSVHILSVDREDVDDVAFSVQFQQTSPVSISYIDGATIKTQLLSTSSSPETSVPSLEDELAELQMLKQQLLALEHSIALKVTHISSTFNLGQAEKLLSDCDNLKCFFNTIYDQMKTMASKVYHGSEGTPSAIASQPGGSRWPTSTGGQRPLKEADDDKQLETIPSPEQPGKVGNQDKVTGSISITNNEVDQFQQSLINGSHQVRHILVWVVISLAILINLTIMILMFQCVRLLRQRRQARWEKRRRQLRESRDACNALVATKYLDLIQWLRGEPTRETIEDQEKDAIMRRINEPNSDEESSDTLSISMEEEIAQFRAAAGFVETLVAEEGRGRGLIPNRFPFARPRRASTPSSMSSCPTYRSVDESLPAYDENCSPEYVVDGFRYTPGSSTHGNSSPRSSSPRSSASEDSTTCSSLDENVEKKD
ncbi:hypothetical protein F5B22DRAFT_636935 [Xylaria bambusicola]|uniref:uncharacterized protein n=1 Tax=Xylaria bambusicola TaxID=326684 RepID=UPI0020073671|nr:uncharacterized protein F5B22DRAFT_636935 [Xylaria bambusicola]KAI0514866.1 hypothetical protein F5B22DRAFT_636935 [Xylaria bambusicola]